MHMLKLDMNIHWIWIPMCIRYELWRFAGVSVGDFHCMHMHATDMETHVHAYAYDGYGYPRARL